MTTIERAKWTTIETGHPDGMPDLPCPRPSGKATWEQPGPRPEALAKGRVLAYVDGSEWSLQALCHLLRPGVERLTLLYVASRATAGYLETGRMALEMAMHRSRLSPADSGLRCRLEIGDPASRVPAVCREEDAGLVTMGFVVTTRFLQRPDHGEMMQRVWTESGRPVLLASPRGLELVTDEERLLIAARTQRPVRAYR